MIKSYQMVIFWVIKYDMDKEIALLIAEMLIKQDETTGQVKEVVSWVDGLTARLKKPIVSSGIL